MTVLALTFLSLAALLGGLAVDAMRFESRRTQVQAALDVCVLNAASLQQSLDERTLFNDCVRKSGLGDTLTSINVVRGTASKTVSASAEENVDTLFLAALGIDRLRVNARSAAMEGVTNLEVSLVLDVSGSMIGSRLAALKVAAKDFVSTLMRNDTKRRVSINLIPYNAQVNLGPELAAKFALTNTPPNLPGGPNVANSRCVDLPDQLYGGSTAVSRTAPFRTTLFADHVSGTNLVSDFVGWTDGNLALPGPQYATCLNVPANQVRLADFSAYAGAAVPDTPERRIRELQGRIDGLWASGQTAINTAMRWGLAFLDPAARPIFAEFAAAGRMPREFAARPYAFDDRDVMKIIVVMSDGENTPVTMMRPEFQDGLSPIWRGNDGNYSIGHTGLPASRRFFVPHNNTFRATPWRNARNTGAAAVQLSWVEVWLRWRVDYVAWQFYARALGATVGQRNDIFWTVRNSFRTATNPRGMDDQLQAVCNDARNRNVVVYTVAFEAPAVGQAQLQRCATTPSRYYAADRMTISQVFAAIAGNITKLRLTQ